MANDEKLTLSDFADELSKPLGWVALGVGNIVVALILGFLHDGPSGMLSANVIWIGVSLCFVAGGAIWWIFGATFSNAVLVILTLASTIAILVGTFVLAPA